MINIATIAKLGFLNEQRIQFVEFIKGLDHMCLIAFLAGVRSLIPLPTYGSLVAPSAAITTGLYGLRRVRRNKNNGRGLAVFGVVAGGLAIIAWTLGLVHVLDATVRLLHSGA